MADIFVTIYTDASFKGEDESYFSFSAKCDKGKLEHVAQIDRKIKDCGEAEMYAVCASIYMCEKKWPHLKGFFINTDAMICCHTFWPHHNTPNHEPIKEMYKKLMDMLGNKWVRVKWIKGHSNHKGIRSYMNEKVDQMMRRK